METTIFKEFRFEAAHKLPNVPTGHKCGRLHGHSYRFIVEICGKVDELSGFIIDFGDVKQVLSPIIDILDHNYLNDIPGLENPTAEILSKWLYENISKSLKINKVTIFETCTAGASYGN